MTIKHIKHSRHWQITTNEIPIGANWNSFESLDEAKEYFANIVKYIGLTYGFLETRTELWEIV